MNLIMYDGKALSNRRDDGNLPNEAHRDDERKVWGNQSSVPMDNLLRHDG